MADLPSMMRPASDSADLPSAGDVSDDDPLSLFLPEYAEIRLRGDAPCRRDQVDQCLGGHTPSSQPEPFETTTSRAPARRPHGSVLSTCTRAWESASGARDVCARTLHQYGIAFVTMTSRAIRALLNTGASIRRVTAAATLAISTALLRSLFDDLATMMAGHDRWPRTAVPLLTFVCGVSVGVLVVSPVTPTTERRVPLASSNIAAASAALAAPILPTARAVSNDVPTAPFYTASSVPTNRATTDRVTSTTTGRARRTQAVLRGSLSVRSRPQGARVFVNGRMVGTTPILVRSQPAGPRVVRITLDGYDVWSSSVRVVGNEQNIVTAKLRRTSKTVPRDNVTTIAARTQ